MGGGAMVAQLTLDQKVAGSNPARPAMNLRVKRPMRRLSDATVAGIFARFLQGRV